MWTIEQLDKLTIKSGKHEKPNGGVEIGPCRTECATIRAMPGDLFYGDNLDVMRRHIADESVDLIYLDPPFNSNRTYNLIHKGSQAQQRAFVDTWHWAEAEPAFRALTDQIPPGVMVPQELSAMMLTLRTFLSDHRDTLAYLSMMAIRLVEMKRILRNTGSIYLHCDPTASHYLKMILDSIFGLENFRNEIIWKRTGSHNSASAFGPVHDVILFYAKSAAATCNPGTHAHSAKYLEHFGKVDAATGKNFQDVSLTGPGTRKGDSGLAWRNYNPTDKGRHWQPASYVYEKYTKMTGDDLAKYPLIDRLDKLDAVGMIYWTKNGQPRYKQFLEDVEKEGSPLQDVWTDIDVINSQADERTGFPTQKPDPLLERIIQASSKVGQLVLDPFCGCGTTVVAAEKLGRQWIGIDIAIRAVDVIKERLDERYQPRVWTEQGEPADIDQAAHLAETNAYDFQWWAVRMLGGRPPKGEKKKGGDGGVDGELIVVDDAGKQRRGVISVKGGRTLIPDFVKALRSTVDLEKADFGVLVTMYDPTPGMREVAMDFGVASWASAYEGKLAHRIRLVTVPEILSKQVRFAGRVEAPRTRSAPPPAEAREGETLQIPFPARMPQMKKARVRNPATARTKPYESVTNEVKNVAESGRHTKK